MVQELLATYLGIYITIISAIFIFRYDSFMDYAEEFADNTYMRYNVAFAELAAGLGIVLLNNAWTFDYRGVVTFLGLLMALEAVFHLLATDEQEERLIQKINKDHYWRYYGVITLGLGIYLATKGLAGF